MTDRCAAIEEDKFVIRMPEDLYCNVGEQATFNGRSLNSEVKQALLHWFDAESSPRMIREIIITQLGPSWSGIALAKVKDVPVDGPTDRKFCVRLLPGQRTRLKAEAVAMKISMNTFVLCVVGWWIRTHRETESLLELYREKQVAQ